MRPHRIVQALAVLALLTVALPSLRAATYRNWVAQVPGTSAVTQYTTVRVWMNSDTAFGETAGLEYVVGGVYTKVLGTYDTSYPGANWRADIPAKGAGTSVSYQLFTRNASGGDEGFTGFNWSYTVKRAPNYVYHQRTSGDVGDGSTGYLAVKNPDGSTQDTTASPTNLQSQIVRNRVEYQFDTNNWRLYYTTDGSSPAGALGVGSGTTQVVTGSWLKTVGSGPLVDVIQTEIPRQPAGTTVKYILSAWHSDSNFEVFANSGTFTNATPATTAAAATVFSYTVARASLSGAATLWTYSGSSVVSDPVAYSGKAYIVDSAGNLRALNTSDGTVDASFGDSGVVALGAPVTGRITLKGTPGGVRMYMVTSAGDLWMMDTSGSPATRYHTQPAGATASTTSCTPAVIVDNGVTLVYLPVKVGGSVYLCKVEDSPSLTTASILLSGATDATSPSVVADGSRIQIGTTQSNGSGRVYSVVAVDLTLTNMAPTDNPVIAPPVLSFVPTVFLVGDAPASGNGSMYAFSTSNSAAIGTWGTSGKTGVSGRVEYSPFIDYQATRNDPTHAAASVIYVGTSAGAVYALSSTSGSSASAGFPVTYSGAAVSGSPLLLNSKLYIPSGDGMLVTDVSTPTQESRYVTGTAMSSPSAVLGGASLVSRGANGNVYGLSAQ